MSTPGAGHVTALVPIIGAFVAGRDEVVVASGPEAASIVEKTGARFALASIDCFVSWIHNIHQTLMSTNLKLITRCFVNMR